MAPGPPSLVRSPSVLHCPLVVVILRHSIIHSVLNKNPVNMSWAVEEWKEGLSPRVLQKIQELESQVDKLKEERQQSQFQLESLEAAFQKQKIENEKNEAATLKRENQSLIELCDNLEKAKQKISHDLRVKESQANIQSWQLNSSKKDIKRLEQELKRYKSELERSQQTLIAGDLSFSGTPQKNSTVPLTPAQSHNASRVTVRRVHCFNHKTLSGKMMQGHLREENPFKERTAHIEEKVMAAKQRLEHDTSDLAQKLCRAEQALLAAQTKETDLTRSFE
ncbi:PREDICTED: centromere protein F-like, partial [Apaloderma vittatum]|uniref:centromere protein F-like n=1 Tax=Apaloderma vittatum TaxID=57397 RepID=UPI0005219926